MRLLLVALALLVAAPTQALTTLSYQGTIDFVDDVGGVLPPEVTFGASFTVDLQFEETSVALYADTGTYGLYTTTPAPVITANFSGSVINIPGGVYPGFPIDGFVGNDATLGAGEGFANLPCVACDSWSLGASNDLSLVVSVIYLDPTATVLSDRAFFIPSDTDFTGWDAVVLNFNDPNLGTVAARGTLSPLPEPSTGFLFTLGLLGVARARSRLPAVH